jgi:phosphoserine phosphatase
MRYFSSRKLLLLCAAFLFALTVTAEDLASWNDSPTKRAIMAFVHTTTTAGSKDFVEPADRIAVFDNDGTLWAEQPMYFQFLFAMDRIRALAPKHPEWKTQQPYAAVLNGDMQALAAGGDKGLLEIVAATHSGMTTTEFNTIVRDWLTTAEHPKFKRPYTDLVYRPMLELLQYLRANNFKTFIVSGGGVEFMRPFTETIYGIPPEQVIGSSGATRFEVRNGKPVLIKLPTVEFIDDGPGKPAGINRFIGRQPIFAFGNSDGDRQMLEWTAAAPGAHFAGLVHHTDGEREWAYDRQSKIGKLDKAFDEAAEKNWSVVDMKNDWKVIFNFQAQ